MVHERNLHRKTVKLPIGSADNETTIGVPGIRLRARKRMFPASMGKAGAAGFIGVLLLMCLSAVGCYRPSAPEPPRQTYCPEGRFDTTGRYARCICPYGETKSFLGPTGRYATCRRIRPGQPEEPICSILCLAPPQGCRYVGQLTTGPCDEVTCGRVVCPNEPAYR